MEKKTKLIDAFKKTPLYDLHVHTGGSYTPENFFALYKVTKEGVNVNKMFNTDTQLYGGSQDATGAIDQAIVNFKENESLQYKPSKIAITEHNTFGSISNFINLLNNLIDINNKTNGENIPKYSHNRVKHRINGIDVIPGIEVTCVVPGVKSDRNADLKVHLLVYGAQYDGNTFFSKLINAKHENDLLNDTGLFKIIEKKYGIKFTEEKIKNYIVYRKQENPGFSRFEANDIIEFLKKNKVVVGDDYDTVKKLLLNAPHIERMRLSIYDVINVAHANGGICILAHPGRNFNRIKIESSTKRIVNKDNSKGLSRNDILRFSASTKLAKQLIEAGIDGFELNYNNKSYMIEKAIKLAVELSNKEDKMLYTAGSDTHFNFNDQLLLKSNMGYTTNGPITEKGIDKFLWEIDKLDCCRRMGKITHRYYPDIDNKRIENIVSQYTSQSKEITNRFEAELIKKFEFSGYDKKNRGKNQLLRKINKYEIIKQMTKTHNIVNPDNKKNIKKQKKLSSNTLSHKTYQDKKLENNNTSKIYQDIDKSK